MAVTGATTAGIKYPQSTDAVSLASDLQAISQSVQDKTVINGITSYTNDVGSGWLARGTGSSTGGGILMTNTTPAGVDDRTWGLYVRTGGDVALATYDSAFSNTGAQFVALRNGTVKTDNATIANIDAGSSKTLITKEYLDSKNFTAGNVSGLMIQRGTWSGTIGVTNSQNGLSLGNITWPTAFSSAPVAVCSMGSAPGGTQNLVPRIINASTTTGALYVYNPGASASTSVAANISWIAIGVG